MRIGLASDALHLAEALRRMLAQAPEHRLAWAAGSGEEAVRLCRDEPPDLVLMDLALPGLDAVGATRRIMAEAPCAILLVAAGAATETSRIFEAIGHGALDVADAPDAVALLRKVSSIGRLVGGQRGPARPKPPGGRFSAARHALVAIGASAGGPAALSALLGGLPADFPAAIVIIQHVDDRFAAGMATWLGEHSAMPVLLAREGDTPRPGTVLLAAGDNHLTLKSAMQLGYTAEPSDYVYRPSVDVFFRSVAQLWKGEAIGVLLTGMGRDGAQGLKALRSRGCFTIAQDRATSAVYGMPKSAAELDAAVEILPLSAIAPRLIGATARGGQEGPRS